MNSGIKDGLKILLLGDYSNCHYNLAQGLKKLGCGVTLMSPVNYITSDKVDVDTSRKSGKLGGLMLFVKAMSVWHEKLKGYDIVAVNDPVFFNLRPERLFPLFNRLKRENKSVFYTAMSIDNNYLRMCENPSSPLRFNEFFIDGKPSPWNLQHPELLDSWKNPVLTKYQDYFFDNIDGAVSVLYEYHEGLSQRFSAGKIAYGGIPVDTSAIPFVGIPLNKKVRVLLCRDRHRIKMKGSDLLEEAAKRVVDINADRVELVVAENLPYSRFIEELKKSDIVLDQVYSYTPATTALLAMAMGKTVVSGGEEEYYSFIDEKDNKPIINGVTDVDSLAAEIERAAFDRDFLRKNAEKSREFVIRHNDSETVARRFLDFWTGRLQEIKA